MDDVFGFVTFTDGVVGASGFLGDESDEVVAVAYDEGIADERCGAPIAFIVGAMLDEFEGSLGGELAGIGVDALGTTGADGGGF